MPSRIIPRIVTAPSKYLPHSQLYYGCNGGIFYFYFFAEDPLFHWKVVDIRDACL